MNMHVGQVAGPCRCGQGDNWGQWVWDGTAWRCHPGASECDDRRGGVRGPIIGSVNGRPAGDGEVGELIKGSQTPVSFTVAQATYNIQPMVVPAGDWDVRGYLKFSAGINAASVKLNPVPSGMSNPQEAQMWTNAATSTSAGPILQLPTAQLLTSTPTLLPYLLDITGNATAGAGQFWLYIEARRVR